MKFRGTVAAAVSLSFTFLCTNFVFAQNTANNEILVYPPKKPPVTKKWYLPLEFGEGRFTTGVYSGLNRFSRRRVDADKLDPFADRPLPTRKRESSSFKPGTWNWRPGMKRPAFSYKYKIINLTKDAQGSYEGMPGDYRQNYRPIPHVRFGGTFAPIPPLMGDPTQHRRGWYIKKYAEKRPKKEQYNQYVMDIVNDKIDESYPSLEWVTYSWKHPHKWKYNLTEDKVRPRFGSYEAFSNYDSRFPAYEPKKRYEVIKIPVVPPIHKRSAEKEEPSEKAPKSIDLRSVPSKSEDVIRRLQSASSIMASALRTAKLRQEQKAESEISSSDYDSNEMLDSDKSISLSSVYESSGTNSSSSSSFIDSEELRKDMHPVGNDKGKKILLFNANGKQQQQEQKHNHYQQNIVANNMRYGRHKRSPPRKESVEKLAKKLYLAPKKEESRWTFKNMPEHAPEIPSLSIFRLEDQVGKQKQKHLKMHHKVINSNWNDKHTRERYNKLSRKLYTAQDAPLKTEEKISDTYVPEPFVPPIQYQPDSFWDSIYGRTKEKSNDSSSDSDSDSTDEATMKQLITTMKVAPKVHPGIVLPQDKKKSFLHLMGKTEPSDPQKLKLEVPRDDADLKGKGAFRFPTFPPVPPRPYKQPTPYVQPTIPPRPPPQQPFVRFAAVHQDKIINAQHTENNIFHLQNSGRASPYVLADSVKARIVKDNVDHIKHDMLHVQNRGEDKQITGSRVDYTKRRENVIKDNSDRIQSDMNDIQNGVHHNGGKKDLFASIPHLHGNKELHRSFGLPAVRKRKLEHVLRFGDDRLYDPEEISENDKAVMQHARGQRHNHIARDLQTVADNTKNIKTSPNIVNHVQDSKLQNRASDDHKVEQPVHKQSGKAVHPGVMNKVEDVRKHMVMKRHAIYSAYRDDHPYSRHRMGLYMPRPGDIRYLSQGLTVPPYQMGRSSKTTMNIAPKDYENGIIFKRSLDDRASDNLSVSKNSASSKDEDVASSNVKSGVGGIDIKDEDVLSEVKDISGIDDYDAGNITANATTTISGRSKRNANPESKKKKFKKYHKQLKEKNNNKLSSPQDMLSSITKELKEQLVTDMNHGKRKTDRQKNNVPNTIMKNDTDGKTNNNNNNNNSRSKAVPPIHLVKKITEEIYNNLDQRYPLHKSGNTALNSRVTVIRARPGEGDQFLPIQHAPIQVRLNKKTGEYQIRYINKDATINSPDSVRFFNGSIHEDKAKRKQMWQQFDERLRNVKAGMTAALTVTTENTPVTEASSSHEKRTRKKRRRVVKKIVRVRRRKTTTQEPTELSDTVKTNEEFETDDILDIRRSKEKYIKMKKVVTKRRGRKRKVTEKPTFISTDIFREKIQSPEMSETVSNISSTHTTYAVSSSEGEKSMYFTSVKPVTTTISSTQLSTIMGTQSKPSLVASTELPQTVSVKPVIRNVTSYSSYLYSKYDTIGTMTRVVTTVTSAQRPRTTIAQETSDEFLMSSSETTKRSILVTTRKSWERPKHVMPVTFYRTSKATEYPKIHITTETVKRSGPTTAASVRRSKEMFNLTMARERVETLTYSTALPRGTVTDESYKTSKTQSSVSAVDNEVDNTTLFTTSKTLTSTCEYSTETTTEGTTELSEDISNDTTRLTTFATIVPNVSADVIGSTISEVTTETVRETTEEPTLPWRPPTVVFKVYDFPTVSPPFSKTERTKQPKVFRGGRLKGGWYDRYAPYSSRSLGGRYKPQQPATYKPYWDNQWNRYSGRYNRGRKHVLPKYTWQRGRWLPADIPESATPMPVAAMVSVESTSLAEIGTSPVSMKLDDEYVTPTTYEDLMTLSATDEQWTTIIPSTETQHETLSISEEHMISSSVRKEDHPTVVPYQQTTHITSSSHRPQTTVEPHQQTLVTSSSQKTQTTTDPYQQTYKTSSSHKPQTTVVPYQQTYATSSHKPEKTIQPTEIYKRIASQTSAEEEYTTLTTPYNKFLTTLLPTEKHMHHVTEYVSEPTSSESEDTLPTEKHMHHVTEYVSEPTSSESEGTLSTEKHMHHVTEYVSEPTSSESEDMLPTKKHTHHVTEYVSEPTSLESEGTLPTEKHMHHVTEYVSEPTSSEFEDTVHSMEHKKFTTARSFPMDRHSVQSPLIKTYTLSTVISMLDHTTLHPVTEKHTTSVEDYISEFLQELDAHTTRIPFSAAPTLKYTTPPTVAPSTIKEVHTTSEPLPQKPVMPKEVPSYKGPKFEWPVFDTKKIFTTVSPLSDILLQSPHLEQVHEDTVKSETQTSKGESTSIKHTDESFSYGEKMLHSTGESIVIEPTSVGVDYVTATPTTEDEYSLLKVVADTDLVSEEDGVLKKIFVNPFKKVKKFFKDSFESESVERHYINYDEPNGTEEYDFNDIYNEPYFDKNATKAHFTEMRFKGTYVTVRTIYRRPSNFTFPPTPPRTKRPTTQPPPTKATTKPPKLGIFGFMKHKAKNAFKNFANFFTPELNDEEEEMRIMRKNVMVEEDEDDDDEH